jgi:hypothetical protein
MGLENYNLLLVARNGILEYAFTVVESHNSAFQNLAFSAKTGGQLMHEKSPGSSNHILIPQSK